MNEGYEELNERTGHKTRTIPGLTFELDHGFPLLTLRKIPLKLFIAEQIWFIMGSKDPADFVGKFTKIWDDFKEEDGTIAAAYGYRWRHHFGRDQLAAVMNLLEHEPGSRHGVIVTWDPSDDGLGIGTKKKNVPCPYTFTLNIIGNKLHMHNVIRSNDMMLGCPHDVAGFALLNTILAARLGVKPGKYTHTISNAHIYDIHYKQAWEAIERQSHHPHIFLEAQPDYYDRAKNGDEALVDEIFEILNKQYQPEASIKNMAIVL